MAMGREERRCWRRGGVHLRIACTVTPARIVEERQQQQLELLLEQLYSDAERVGE
jgi:hypothetical protein